MSDLGENEQEVVIALMNVLVDLPEEKFNSSIRLLTSFFSSLLSTLEEVDSL